jgi:hypothetical protein
MKVTVQIVLQADDAADTPTVVRDVFSLDREALAPDTVGLQLGEAHDLLTAVQHTVVTHQVSAAITAQQPCPHCGQARRHYDGLPRTRQRPRRCRGRRNPADAVSGPCKNPARAPSHPTPPSEQVCVTPILPTIRRNT